VVEGLGKPAYNRGMGVVHTIGSGYYGIETQGVDISVEVRSSVNSAFEAAAGIASDELNIQFSYAPGDQEDADS
jgi:hypothetical protein